jgi:hypothetical protein
VSIAAYNKSLNKEDKQSKQSLFDSNRALSVNELQDVRCLT